ncbi:MAG TPA: metallophosphoesterase [Pyrinomonadaceae bacterium]|jgi:predicted MPP superfamily phosphohydrolase|nr:metallophosphoesterase [Pyrinomonadaceae bacterium]
MRKINILWAEDNSTTFALHEGNLRSFLGARGISATITRAEDGNAVFRHLSYPELRFAALLTDIDMPHFNGLDTVKALKKQYPGLPMIVVSDYTTSPEYAPILSELSDTKVITGYFAVQSEEAWFEATWHAVARTAPTILHLSDIHFGSDHAFQAKLGIGDLITIALRNITKGGPIDLVVVSGDLTSEGTEDEFRQADEFLFSVAQTLEIDVNRFVIVPGNHDIYRREEVGRRFSKFVEFLDGFYRRSADPMVAFSRYPDLYDVHREWLHWDAKKHSEQSLYSISIYDELETVVIGLNSVISSGELRLDLSKIEPKQLISVSDALDELGSPRSNYFRVAVFHHNPFVVPSFSAEGEPERVVRNPALVLHELIKNQVRLVLHGHSHYSIGFKYVPLFLEEDKRTSAPLHVFGAGTLSGKDLAVAQSYYHFTTIRCELNEEGSVTSVGVTPYRLKDDRLDWQSLQRVDVILQ